MSSDVSHSVAPHSDDLIEENAEGALEEDELYLCKPKPKPKLFSYNWAQGTMN